MHAFCRVALKLLVVMCIAGRPLASQNAVYGPWP